MNGLFSTDMLALLAPAFVAGLLVASTHVPLGREVLRRGIIFLDLAVAQIAGLGAVAAAVFFHWEGIAGQIAAFVSALAASFIFSSIEKKGQTIQEAFIGCAFVIAASIAVLILSGDPHGGEEISNLMAGQILWVRWENLGLIALVYAPLLTLMLSKPNVMQKFFYPIFAACITLSVQIVGVYLVFAALILPALATMHDAPKKGVVIGYAISFIAVAGGLAVSVLNDLPAGPVIVCAYAISAAGISLINRRKGGC